MNKIKLIILFIIFSSCTKKYPYEKEITKYFAETKKVEIEVQEIKIDTTVTKEQAKNLFEQRLKNHKIWLTEYYQREYVSAKSEYERMLKKYGTRHPAIYSYEKDRMNEMSLKWKNSKEGNFPSDEKLIQFYIEQIASESSYEQLTLRYKLYADGPVLIQVFVCEATSNDSTLQPTSKDLKYFLTH